MPTEEDSPRDRPEPAERWGVVTKTILPAVTALRQHVGMTETIFRTQTFHCLPREFFLWTALDEVLKTGVFLMRLDGFLGDDLPQRRPVEDDHPTARAIEAILLEEEGLRVRRLCELLVQLVLFGRKDAPELYGHFLLLEDLARATSYNGDLDEFHGVSSDWVRVTVDRTLTELRALEARVDVNDAWYVEPRALRVGVSAFGALPAPASLYEPSRGRSGRGSTRISACPSPHASQTPSRSTRSASSPRSVRARLPAWIGSPPPQASPRCPLRSRGRRRKLRRGRPRPVPEERHDGGATRMQSSACSYYEGLTGLERRRSAWCSVQREARSSV